MGHPLRLRWRGIAMLGNAEPRAEIPFVVEAFAPHPKVRLHRLRTETQDHEQRSEDSGRDDS